MRGEAYLFRYADDFLALFEYEDDAASTMKYCQRVGKFNLEVAWKTRMIPLKNLARDLDFGFHPYHGKGRKRLPCGASDK